MLQIEADHKYKHAFRQGLQTFQTFQAVLPRFVKPRRVDKTFPPGYIGCIFINIPRCSMVVAKSSGEKYIQTWLDLTRYKHLTGCQRIWRLSLHEAAFNCCSQNTQGKEPSGYCAAAAVFHHFSKITRHQVQYPILAFLPPFCLDIGCVAFGAVSVISMRCWWYGGAWIFLRISTGKANNDHPSENEAHNGS